ncbi:unnamed protein product, partial [Darwinula stevensoni]
SVGGRSVGVCIHHKRKKLENLRTLILANNHLRELVLHYTDEESLDIMVGMGRQRLLFPALTMLDVSNNQISIIPSVIHELSSLSVLNISANPDITELPPEMGLLNRLWNLGCLGCNLQDPLRGMLESHRYKTIDVIGYLRSVLEDSKPYARLKLMVVGIQGIGKTSLLEQLRAEGSTLVHAKRKPPDHWGKRMGTMKNVKPGTNLSTVGVDIADWMCERSGRNTPPVTFRTWDFGGQREYYATHQYFLSKRSLYLVVWKITDGEAGIRSLQQWLVNIQARAPNSPVIIVGTHYDLVKDHLPPSYAEHLQSLIRTKFIGIIDPDKSGLPRVVETLEVSCRTRYNLRTLANLIYDTAYSLRSPGGKEKLLEQKIPAVYLALEEVIGLVAAQRRVQGKDPVLTADEYHFQVSHEMASRGKGFRDIAELNQATSFLHENGVLLHYEDAALRDLYFLDPQWLCDMLAHVVTIREINPFAKNGIMKLQDLSLVFKNISWTPTKQNYLVNLLNKFEVALTWDSRSLLIPSLLPSEIQIRAGIPGCEVRIPVRSRTWALRPHRLSTSECEDGGGLSHRETGVTVSHMTPKGVEPLRRLLFISYFPAGFWSRLLTRILADDSFISIIQAYFDAPKQATQKHSLGCTLGTPELA